MYTADLELSSHGTLYRVISGAPICVNRQTQTLTSRILPAVPGRSDSEHYLDGDGPSGKAWSTTVEEGLSDSYYEPSFSSSSVSPRVSPGRDSPEYYQMVYGTPCYKP